MLFTIFVVVQARYLFGGRSLVEAREQLSYATYARHGFFELVAVSALVLVVIVGANALVRSRLVRALSAILVALELVVAVSALQRLRLYEQEYGLTELRVWTTGVVLWLMCVFVWLSVTTLRGRGRFAVGARARLCGDSSAQRPEPGCAHRAHEPVATARRHRVSRASERRCRADAGLAASIAASGSPCRPGAEAP